MGLGREVGMPDIFVSDPLPWYIAGPLLGLFVPVMLLLTGRDLGVSSSFRHVCSVVLPKNIKAKIIYFDYDWRTQGAWQLLFVLGIGLGGFTTMQFFGGAGVTLADPAGYTPWGALGLFGGGLLVGFGTRWADGCTSGHTIAGISHLKWSSLVASVCFIAGGVAASLIHILFLGGKVL